MQRRPKTFNGIYLTKGWSEGGHGAADASNPISEVDVKTGRKPWQPQRLTGRRWTEEDKENYTVPNVSQF